MRLATSLPDSYFLTRCVSVSVSQYVVWQSVVACLLIDPSMIYKWTLMVGLILLSFLRQTVRDVQVPHN